MRIALPVLATLTLTLPVMAACGGGHKKPAAGAGTPAVSKQQAAQVLADYQSANNQANRTLDDSALSSIETGAQLSMDAAAYKMRRVTKQKFTDFSFTKPTFYIPRLTGYPRWFAVDALSDPSTKGQPVHHALLFRQETPGAPWRLAADPYVSGDSTPLSDIELDKDGFATRVSPDAGQLALPPSKVAPAHAELLTSGPAAHGAVGMAKGPQTSQAYDALQQARGGFAKLGVNLTSRFTPSGQPTYALLTTDGGAIVWYVLQQVETYAANKPGTISVTGDLVGLAPAGRVEKRLDTTVLVQYLAKDPAKGTATVYGIYRKAVQATAS